VPVRFRGSIGRPAINGVSFTPVCEFGLALISRIQSRPRKIMRAQPTCTLRDRRLCTCEIIVFVCARCTQTLAKPTPASALKSPELSRPFQPLPAASPLGLRVHTRKRILASVKAARTATYFWSILHPFVNSAAASLSTSCT
jgi:hypothetical protein